MVSRVMRPTTIRLLQRAGIRSGMACLELGCGSGDVAFDMAHMVNPGGRVIGTGIDDTKLGLAREEARERQLDNIEFRFADITQHAPEGEFDLIHARFLLTHLPDPADALMKMWHALRPGGTLVVEDIDFRGYFCHPDSPALWRYVELYTRTAERRGGDANIGPRLPSLLALAGFENIEMHAVQPAGIAGEVKLISPLTMENIADSAVEEGLASREETDRLTAELYEFARTPGTVGCMPRVVEVWGHRAG